MINWNTLGSRRILRKPENYWLTMTALSHLRSISTLVQTISPPLMKHKMILEILKRKVKSCSTTRKLILSLDKSGRTPSNILAAKTVETMKKSLLPLSAKNWDKRLHSCAKETLRMPLRVMVWKYLLSKRARTNFCKSWTLWMTLKIASKKGKSWRKYHRLNQYWG